jgi:hypothetical protein
MKVVWFVSIAAMVMLAAAVPAAAQEQPPVAVDTVRLRFAWPVGTVASVETTRFRELVAAKPDTISGSARYRMRVEQHPEGLLIVHDSASVTSDTERPTGALTAVAITERLRDIVPSYVVGRGGEFLRIDNVTGFKARLDTVLGSVLELADSAAHTSALIDAFMSEEVLTSLAAQEWNALVGMWIDGDLEVGEYYELEEGESPVPMIPGATVPLLLEFGVMRRLACDESGKGRDCVAIELLSYPDPDSMAVILRQFMERANAGGGSAAVAFESLDIENEIELIIEPATLLPHRARVTKKLEAMIVSEGQRTPFTQEDVRTYRFTYRR